MKKDSQGFSLIELLIVVAIILIIAAISIPSLLNTKMVANQSAAVQTLKTLNENEAIYDASFGQGFSSTLAQMGPPASGTQANPGAANLIDSVLAAGLKSGYIFTYVPSPAIGGAIRNYSISADPQQVGTTGRSHYYIDASGAIRVNLSAPASASDSALGG